MFNTTFLQQAVPLRVTCVFYDELTTALLARRRLWRHNLTVVADSSSCRSSMRRVDKGAAAAADRRRERTRCRVAGTA